MARNKGDKARNAQTESGDAVPNRGGGAEAGADYDAAYEHFVAGRIAEAEVLCRKILTSDPTHAKGLHLLGGIAVRSGNVPSAIELYKRALAAKPDFAEAHSNLGTLLLERGEAEKAVSHFEKAIASEPNFALAYNTFGNALIKSGRFRDAEKAFEQAVKFEPENPLGYNNLGALLGRQGRTDEAIAQLEKATELGPDFAMALVNLGNVLLIQGKLDAAEANMRRAVAINPDFAMARSNLGVLLKELGRYDEAEECLNRALATDPDYAPARAKLAHLLLLLGDFGRAWEHYTARETVRNSPRALWQNPLPDDLRGKRLLLLRDQGLGDEIFFLRFAPELKRRGAEITYLADPKIGSITARLPFIDRVLGEGEEPEGVDITLSVGDLPLATDMKSAADIPPPLPLAPEPKRVQRLAAELKKLGPAPYIGVTWRAGLRSPTASKLLKEAPLTGLAMLLRPVNGTFLALQRKPEAGEIDQLSGGLGRPVHDFTALNDDLEEMLALLSLMDEYVTVSNTNVHLRAGTGRTSRVLVPNPPEYRWMAEGQESPWFPGCRVYRQKVDGEWDEALAALAGDLKEAFRG